MKRKRNPFVISTDILRVRGVMKKPLSAELLRGLHAIKRQGYEVSFTSDHATITVHIRNKQSEISPQRSH